MTKRRSINIFTIIVIFSFFLSCSSKNKEKPKNDYSVIEKRMERGKDVYIKHENKLLQHLHYSTSRNWRPKHQTYDTTFYLSSAKIYQSNPSNYLEIKYVSEEPSSIYYHNGEEQTRLYFDYWTNYNQYVNLSQDLSWDDPTVQNGVELLINNCIFCHNSITTMRESIIKLDTTNVSIFKSKLDEIHNDKFADSILNTIDDKDINEIRKIIKKSVEKKVVY